MITGRVADAALFLAPLVHEHGWAWDDWDRLAAGTLVGHVLECSGPERRRQPEPRLVDGAAPVGPPVPDRRGRRRRLGGDHQAEGIGWARQLRHGAPPAPVRSARSAAYLSPDVVADFTSATFTDEGNDRVRVTGVRGRPATDTYKALLAHHVGWAGEARRVLVARGA